MTYVFRNNTIERFFQGDYQFSGYDDFSAIPEADSYIWWYQLPINYNRTQLASEVESYAQKLRFIVSQIGNKQLIILTLVKLYDANGILSDYKLDDAIDGFNATARNLANEHTSVKVIDFSDFTNRYTKSELIDWKFYFLSQMPINPRLSRDFQQWFDQQMNAIVLKRKKCLALDLDNTLWNGVLGEDGIEGIQMDGDYPGKAFHLWQEGLLELANNGVILAVCSKNNEQDVIDLWNSGKNMVLKEKHFSSRRINWNDKATNIREIAAELNIGLDSMVFVDDNATERELIRQQLPMVTVPEWPSQPYELPNFYDTLVREYFAVYSLTDEDKNKTEQYRQNALRAQQQSQFTNMEDFISSLDIQMTIAKATPISVPRIAQMTQKTNQFNLTTHRYTENDINELICQGAQIYTLSVSDKFGDNGITGCIILKKEDNCWSIDTLLLSCRILGKGIENAFVQYVISRLNGKKHLSAEYIATAKNGQVSNFFDKLGMTIVEQDEYHKKYLTPVAEINNAIKDYYHITYND